MHRSQVCQSLCCTRGVASSSAQTHGNQRLARHKARQAHRAALYSNTLSPHKVPTRLPSTGRQAAGSSALTLQRACCAHGRQPSTRRRRAWRRHQRRVSVVPGVSAVFPYSAPRPLACAAGLLYVYTLLINYLLEPKAVVSRLLLLHTHTSHHNTASPHPGACAFSFSHTSTHAWPLFFDAVGCKSRRSLHARGITPLPFACTQHHLL